MAGYFHYTLCPGAIYLVVRNCFKLQSFDFIFFNTVCQGENQQKLVHQVLSFRNVTKAADIRKSIKARLQVNATQHEKDFSSDLFQMNR